jgi:hypothetical protein
MAPRQRKWYLAISVTWCVIVAFAIFQALRRSRSWWLTIFIVSCSVGWAVHAYYKKRSEADRIAALQDWYSRLDALVDIRDFDDDGHLHEYFEPAERELLLQELGRMPQGSRSLRKGIGLINPELTRDDA